jgi:hypothetical protein
MTQLDSPPIRLKGDKEGPLSEDDGVHEVLGDRQPVHEAEFDDEPAEANPPRRAPREQPKPGFSTRKIFVFASVLFFLWLAYAVRKHHIRKTTQPQIIYASR